MFALLRAVDRRDANWLAAQPDKARKEFKPLVAMRYATCVQDGVVAACMLWLINHRVNRHLFDLQKYPDLCYRLLASCGLDRGNLRYDWIAPPRRPVADNAALRLLAEHHPLANDAELRLLLALHGRDGFAKLAADCGLSKEQEKDCMKAYDQITG
jgi:hypothetical protein